MTSRLFRVDMSEGSRDFVAVATEPGLAMLDSAGANYAILRRWFGPLAAEPEMQSPELVSFYVREPERGRLENLQVQTATLSDLRGPLKQDLANLETALRKAQPESANEKLLHKIVAKTIKEQTTGVSDVEAAKSDFDCYFFKVRQGSGPWRLVWCWGYQRRDREPSDAAICSNDECNRLFAHRPKTKRRCPYCQMIVTKKRTPMAIGLWPGLLLALLLLIALIGLLAVLKPSFWPWGAETVVVKPDPVENIAVPVKYKLVEIRPAKIALKVGESQAFDVIGITEDGRDVRLGADQLTFIRQPSAGHVELSRDSMQLRALKETPGSMTLEIQLADLPVATAEVSVAAVPATTAGATTAGAAVTVVEDAWSVYPPVSVSRPGTVMAAGPQVGGPLRFVPGQGLIADNIVAGSPLQLAGLVPGSTLSHIGGNDIRHYSPAQLSDWLAAHPIADGTVLGVVGPDGKPNDVRLGIDLSVLQPVNVVGIVPANVSAGAFDAAVKLKVRDLAEYRIVDDKGHEFGPWTTHGPSAEATIQIAQIPRSAGRNEYEMYVERRLGGDIKRYPFVISLSPSPK